MEFSMKIANIVSAQILIVLLSFGVLTSLCGTTHAEFRAAAAGRIVTPDPLLPVTAGGPGRPVKEKKGELEVRVLVLDDGTTKVAFVSEPFLGFPSGLCRRVYEKVTAIPAENILIGATHTHGAPDPYGFPSFGKGGGANMPYLTDVCQKTADAINEAVEKLQPVTLKINTDEAHGKIAYNYYAPQLYDPRCNIMQAIGKDAKPVATLVNYAIHPEILLDKPILTPDLIGPLYDRITEKGGGIGIFMNSAQGGMITADIRGEKGEDNEVWEECVRIGSTLADEALRIADAATSQTNPRIVCVAKEVRFPLPDKNAMWKMVSKSPVGFRFNDDNTISSRVNLVNVGNAQIMTIPGEALPNIGYYLKRKLHGQYNFLFGLTNDAYGYILTKVDWMSFKRYEYCSETSLGEMTGEILIEEGLKLADSLPAPQ
ncbi:hypothetical protein HY256_03620 [Candidatus Sumerlaeota bacterium]|nr:hypothetical protein [Candidatus Sumerlaeota bacterium]